MARKSLFMILSILAVFLVLVFLFLFVGKAPMAKDITWGVNFSQKHASLLGLDWKETYLALLKDLGTRNLKIAAHWDLLHPQKDDFFFEDLDWQMEKAGEYNAKVLLAVGMKTPRWPECHIPDWAKALSQEEQQETILAMLREVVQRYKDSPALFAWQVENEPFFPFGECPFASELFLKKEAELVKSLDSSHPILISDSGEGSFWIRAARNGDVVGTTMYRKAWFRQMGFYVNYPFPPVFYWRKAQIIHALFGKEVMVVELQAEPWGPKLLYDSPLEEQEKTMNLEQFKKNIFFAKNTGLKTFYLWGGEWWYWMKEKQQDSAIWQEAENLFSNAL